MPKVIDHIIIELEMDPGKFTAGQKKAAEAFLKIATGAEEAGKRVQEPIQSLGKVMDGLAQKLSNLTTGLIAFETIRKGVNLAQHITETNIALGNLSRVTGISVEELSKWEGVADRMGGSGKSMLSTISGVQKQLQDWATGQGMPRLQQVLKVLQDQGADISAFDSKGDPKKATDLIREIVAAMDKLNIKGDHRTGLLRLIGMDDASIAVFSRGMAKFDEMVEAQRQVLEVTEEDIEIAYQLNNAWVALTQTARAFGLVLMKEVAPPLTEILKKLSEKETKQGNSWEDAIFRGGKGTWDMIRRGDYSGAVGNEFRFSPNKTPQSGSSAPAPAGKFKVDTGKPWTTPPAGVGMTQEQWDLYRQTNANRESSGGNYSLKGGAGGRYDGAYQIGQDARADVQKSLREMPVSRERFRGDPVMQERYMSEFTRLNHERLMKNPRYAALSFEERIKILAYAHNQGAGGAAEYLRTGVAKRDAFGTSGAAYSNDIGNALKGTAPTPIPWMSNPRLLRAPRFNQNVTNDYSTSEMTVHSMIFNDPKKPVTDDAYGLGKDAVPSLDRKMQVITHTEGPN